MKENDKIGYVYLTTNLLNGKQYVGQHLHDGFDKGYKGSGTYIKRALDKYGWDNFTCEVLQWCTTQTQLNEVEDNCIRLYGTMHPNGYNLKGGGSNGRYSKEARKNCSEAHIGQVSPNKGKKASEETRKNISEAKKKYYANEENRKKQSEANKGRIPWNKGKTPSEKTRKKQSEANKGQIPWNKGKTPSEKTRKKQSEAQDKYKKKVYQYTLDGEFVKEWASLSEIKRVLGYDISHISDCCRGKLKTFKGFKWSFKLLN